jgi:hypothetical protein
MDPTPIQRQMVIVGSLLAASITAVIVVFAKPVWEASGSKNPSDWLGFAGNLIAAGGTLLAAYFAFYSVRDQTRIGIVERRAVKIESELPGLHEVERLTDSLSEIISGGDVTLEVALEALSGLGFSSTDSNFVREVEAKLPSTSDTIRRRLAQRIFQLRNSAAANRISRDHIEDLEYAMVGNALPAEVRQGYIEILPRLRRECETYERHFLSDKDALRAFHPEMLDRLMSGIQELEVCESAIAHFYRQR